MTSRHSGVIGGVGSCSISHNSPVITGAYTDTVYIDKAAVSCMVIHCASNDMVDFCEPSPLPLERSYSNECDL